MTFIQDNLAAIVATCVVIGLWILLRTKGTKFETSTSIDSMIATGKPAVLEFFSNG